MRKTREKKMELWDLNP